MKVKALIELLKQFDEDLEVLMYEDGYNYYIITEKDIGLMNKEDVKGFVNIKEDKAVVFGIY